MASNIISPSMKNRIPALCPKCHDLFMVVNLTECPNCGPSVKLDHAAVIHFCEPCDVSDRDLRFPKVLSDSPWSKTSFRIPCQPNANATDTRPKHMSADINAVTCPRCFEILGVEFDEKTRPLL